MKRNNKLVKSGVGVCTTALLCSIAMGTVVFAAPVGTDYIGEEKAKDIALTHAGIGKNDLDYIFARLDYDNDVAEYEMEFWSNNKEYDYEIDAKTGNVVSYDYDAENYFPATARLSYEIENYIGDKKAQSIAFKHAGVNENEVVCVINRLDYNDDIAEYEVEFWVNNIEYDYEINAKTGKISSYDYDAEYDYKAPINPPTSTANNYIGQAKAKSIALKDAGVKPSNALYVSCEFDIDDGVAEYEVEWIIGRTEYEYTISATHGTILERDMDYD